MPKGALLVNGRHSRSGSPRRSNAGRRSATSHTRAARSVPLAKLFAAMGGLHKNNPLFVANPLFTVNGGRASRLTNKGRRTLRRAAHRAPRDNKGRFKRNSHRRARPNSGRRARHGGRRHARPNNMYSVQNGGRKHHRRGRYAHNPLMVMNRGRRGGWRYNRNNPLMVMNRGRRGRYNRNPGVIATVSQAAGKVPVIGMVLRPMVISLAGAGIGALVTWPTFHIAKALGPHVPEKIRPVAYSLVGAILSGLVAAFVPRGFRYKGMLVGALAASGGAVDMFRHLSGTSMNLGGDEGYGWEDDDYSGAGGEIGDAGEGGETASADYGSDGNVHPAEWGAASLVDAAYSGEDFTDGELHSIELGRVAFREAYADLGRQHRPRRPHGDGSSLYAGQPGSRWGWMAYWIGHNQLRVIARMPRDQRRATIQRIRHASLEAAKHAVEIGKKSFDMESMDQAGLLALHGA